MNGSTLPGFSDQPAEVPASGSEVRFDVHAKSLEASFRALAAAAAARHAPEGAVAGALYRHVPATFQSVIAADGPAEGVSADALDPESIDIVRSEGTVLPEDVAGIGFDVENHPDEQAVESARILGAVEQHFGADVDVLFGRWIKATGAASAGPDVALEFADALSRRAVGYLDDPLPGVGAVPLVRWSAPEAASRDFAVFAASAGRAMFGRVVGERMRLLGWPGDSVPGAVPAIAVLEGARLGGRLEEANGAGMEMLAERVMSAVSGLDLEGLAEAVARIAGGIPADPSSPLLPEDIGLTVPEMAYRHEDGLEPLPAPAVSEKPALEQVA